MSKVRLATTAGLVLLATMCLSAQAASALERLTPRPAPPGFQTGALSSSLTAPSTSLTAPSTGLRAPARIGLAPVACDGKFNVVASPNGTGNNFLFSVAAVNVNDVWAVGNSTNSAGWDRTLAEHWNGNSWAVVPTLNPSSFHSDLNGVTAISTNDVWAVGTYQVDSSGNLQTFAEHWNGTSWSLDLSTANPTFFSILSAVTAISSTDVWAVGTYYNSGFLSLTEHWNGTLWSSVSSPNASFTDNELVGVSAWSSTDIWAVGESGGTLTTPPQSLAEHWNGGSWSLIATPNLGPGGASNVIVGVAALEANHAVGVGLGNFVSGSTPRRGEAWDLLTGAPSTSLYEIGPGVGDNALLSVARSGAGVWAVGYWRNTATSARQTLVKQATWDSAGHTLTWTLASGTSASPSTVNNALLGVAAISPHVFWATGYSAQATVAKTLTELYCGLHFNVTAPATTTAGVPFSLTVTATNANASTATGYLGTVHFTSTDSLAVLPPDYTFTPGDAGVHTFSGVALTTPYNQTITASDTVTPFVKGSATVKVFCLGACPSAGGTAGGRDVSPGPASSPGTRAAANQSAAGAIGSRVPVLPAGIGGPSTNTAHSATSTVPNHAALRILVPMTTRAEVKAAPRLATKRLAVTQARDQVLVFQRTASPPGETDSVGNAELAISLGLLVFGLFALRRRRIGEELNVRNKA